MKGALAIALLVLAACGSDSSGQGSSLTCSSSTAFPSSALSSVATDAGKLRVELRTAPEQPLVSGLDCVELTVTDPSSGAPVDGLTITMTPWMPAMGHGASVTPAVTALGQGRYVFSRVGLPMPGEWQLRTQFSGRVNDSVEPTFNVN